MHPIGKFISIKLQKNKNVKKNGTHVSVNVGCQHSQHYVTKTSKSHKRSAVLNGSRSMSMFFLNSSILVVLDLFEVSTANSTIEKQFISSPSKLHAIFSCKKHVN